MYVNFVIRDPNQTNAEADKDEKPQRPNFLDLPKRTNMSQEIISPVAPLHCSTPNETNEDAAHNSTEEVSKTMETVSEGPEENLPGLSTVFISDESTSVLFVAFVPATIPQTPQSF